MKVEITRVCDRGQCCDTVRIKDYDLREVYFKRAHLPRLIQMLKAERKRHQGALV